MLDVSQPYGPRRRRKKVCATQRAAQAALLDLQLHARQRGDTPAAPTMTVGAWVTQWLASPTTQRRPMTQRSYTQTIRDHVLPYLEHRPVSSLTVPVLQRWLDELVINGRTPRVIQMARAVLRASLTHAVRFGLLPHNPALYLSTPRVTARRVVPASVPELTRLAAAGPPWFATWLLVTVALGLRRGESLGLWWDDIDWNAGRISVNRAVLEHGLVGAPKTDSGQRTYQAPPIVLGALRFHRRRVELEAMSAHRTVAQWVFSTSSGRPLSPRNLSRTFYAARTTGKVRDTLRIHDLRHTAGTMLLNAKTDPKTIAAWLGHADVRTTLRLYAQTTDALGLDASQKMQRALPPGSHEGA